jgi:hypothetical protein
MVMTTGERDNAGIEEDDDLPDPPRPPWSAKAQVVAAVLWPSFLSACMATMLFFAFIDPELLGHQTTLEINRMTGYGIGFFFFWFIAAVSSAVSVYLLRTAHLLDTGPDRDTRP